MKISHMHEFAAGLRFFVFVLFAAFLVCDRVLADNVSRADFGGDLMMDILRYEKIMNALNNSSCLNGLMNPPSNYYQFIRG